MTATKPLNRVREAVEMIDLFESVDARTFDLTFTDFDGRTRGFRRGRSTEDVRRSMSSTLISTCVARRTNVIVRPHRPPAVSLIQLDDLDSAKLDRVTPVMFMAVSTSEKNYQAWVAVEGSSDFADFGRRVKKATGADLNASGATRISGSVNFKRKYSPNFPTVVIVGAWPGRIVGATKVDRMGLVTAAETLPPIIPREARRGRVVGLPGGWPDYASNLARAPCTKEGLPDRSNADFVWCMTAISWGWSIEATADQLIVVSEKARERIEQRHDKAYPLVTAQSAAAAVHRRMLRPTANAVQQERETK